jgi:hypothetical protein
MVGLGSDVEVGAAGGGVAEFNELGKGFEAGSAGLSGLFFVCAPANSFHESGWSHVNTIGD